MAFTYILYSSELDRFYIGSTDLSMKERIQKHLTDHSGFTAKSKDWKLVYQKSFNTKLEAIQFEFQIKKWKSRRAIENLIKKG
jgi:putative endonuclease